MPQEKLAELYADPNNNKKWMEDSEGYEPISGKQGMPGSKYRLVSKNGDMKFIVTVTARNLPDEVSLILESSNIQVSVTGKFTAISPEKTKFTSEEVFDFKGIFNKIGAFMVQKQIKDTHHRQMENFKRFAESYK